MIGGSHLVAVAAGWLATARDQDAALPQMSPVAARLHEVVTAWLGDLLGLSTGTAAVFVTGASMANTAALAAARDDQLTRAGWDVQAGGLVGTPELTVITLARPRSGRAEADDEQCGSIAGPDA